MYKKVRHNFNFYQLRNIIILLMHITLLITECFIRDIEF
jgi:hypothetical protein